jgi:prolyl-tRNA synthetase
MGGLIMVHGDNRGLKLPPKLAPVQVIVVPIAQHKEGVVDAAQQVMDALKGAGVRVKMDTRDQSPGWKFNEWEMRGVPIRLEIGPKDIEQGQVVLVRRDTHEKVSVPTGEINERVEALLRDIHDNMLCMAQEHRDAHIFGAKDKAGVLDAVNANRGFALSPWCGERSCEEDFKAEYSTISSRCMPFDKQDELGERACALCGKPAKHMIYWARAY